MSLLVATIKKIQDNNKKQFKMDASATSLRDISKFQPTIAPPAEAVEENEKLGTQSDCNPFTFR